MENILAVGFVSAIFVSLFSALGGMLVFFKKKYSEENITFLLNISAGIMLASSFLTLLAPAVNVILETSDNKFASALLVMVALFLGIALIWVLHLILPHEHELTGRHGISLDLRSSWLFIIAIAIHKFPEGLAVGVAYAGEQIQNPKALALGIALQNIPEGLMVAVTLIGIGFSKFKSALFAGLTGLLQPVGAIIGILATSESEKIVPYGMIWAAGTMLFVIINEIIPETYARKNDNTNSLAIFMGFIVMTFMSIILN